MDAEGDVTVTIPWDLEAYLEMQGPRLLPAALVPRPRREGARAESGGVRRAERSWWAASRQTAGVELDETKGILLVRMIDCTLQPTAGAAVSIFPTEQETRFYTINNTVKADASKTDTSGNSGFVNVSPGAPQVTGTIAPNGKVYGTVSTLVRAGHMTAQILQPTPEL
jgi:hypothetical protein